MYWTTPRETLLWFSRKIHENEGLTTAVILEENSWKWGTHYGCDSQEELMKMRDLLQMWFLRKWGIHYGCDFYGELRKTKDSLRLWFSRPHENEGLTTAVILKENSWTINMRDSLRLWFLRRSHEHERLTAAVIL